MADKTTENLVKLLAKWREDPLAFVNEAFVDPPSPEEWHKDVLLALPAEDRVAIRSGHGVGKALALSTEVPTPEGWRRWGDIQPGDKLFGLDGAPVTVCARYDHKDRPMYRVEFDDGTFLDTCGEHQWAVRGRQERRKSLNGWRVMTTEELAAAGVTRPNGNAVARQWEIPTHAAVQYPEQPLPLDPYLLGCWLGDGNTSAGRITTMDPEIVAAFLCAGFAQGRVDAANTGQAATYTFRGLQGALRAAGVLGDKHVPPAYRTASIEQRMAVLRGLMDTDGWVENGGSRAAFCSTQRQLVDHVAELARSLGFKVMRTGEKLPWFYNEEGEQVFGKPAWRVNFAGEACPFSLPRKVINWRTPSQDRYLKRWIAGIERIDNADCMCVTVDAEDSLFLAGDYIPTHNTALLAWVILWFALTRYPYKVPCTAPSASQLTSALWPELGKWYRKLHPALKRMLRLTSDRLELVSGEGTSFAEARTSRADQPEALQGFHEDNLLFVVDEASGVPDVVFEVGAGSLSTRGAKIILAGNPTRTSGYFYDTFHPKPGQRKWWTRKVSCHESTRVDPTWIEEMKAQYGPDSDVYAVRVLGEFPKTDEQTFIPKHLIEAAVDRRALIELFPGPVVWGVDVGWQGDRSALAKRMGSHLLEPVTWWSKQDTMETVGRVMAAYDATPRHMQPKEILVDVIGIGAGVYSRLKEQGLPASAVNVSNRSTDTGQYNTMRQELWGKVREWFTLPDTTLPDDEELIKELGHLQGKFMSNGRIYPESKQDMKGRNLRSPDIADSFMLTFAASTRWYRTAPRLVETGGHLPAQTNHAYDPRSW